MACKGANESPRSAVVAQQIVAVGIADMKVTIGSKSPAERECQAAAAGRDKGPHQRIGGAVKAQCIIVRIAKEIATDWSGPANAEGPQTPAQRLETPRMPRQLTILLHFIRIYLVVCHRRVSRRSAAACFNPDLGPPGSGTPANPARFNGGGCPSAHGKTLRDA